MCVCTYEGTIQHESYSTDRRNQFTHIYKCIYVHIYFKDHECRNRNNYNWYMTIKLVHAMTIEIADTVGLFDSTL